ncbi:sugar-transfer associated ATP-grasp domain-containing protein [Halomonas sp. JS92-SW72]|uniref:sugar-transfer associated ATP-grasp domain-containing protein n=1 Tax=Halomonas sp. JS92-SW72 TaxID=2306583 RepID=UPI000E5BDE13|nr:sugar-transfer associated ATP-grasp domain-containing protein [Halomonas sp. JS92-SW72]AXY41416.1 hypothetical protein D1793_03965 [Halomonas sp. JS92-SW72]
MFSQYQQDIREMQDGDALQAWKAFSLAYWEEPSYGLSDELQQRLFQAGFLRSRWALYAMEENRVDGYLSDFQAMRLQAANARYQAVMADRVLCSHVLDNYCRTPQIYAVVNAEEVQWMAPPAWLEEGQASGALVLHPLQPGWGAFFQRIVVEGGHFHGSLGEGRSDELVARVQDRARRHGGAYVLTEQVDQGGFAEGLAPGHLNLLNVLLVREPHEWRPQLVAASLLIGRRREDGGEALRVEEGALSASVDPVSGRITACKGLEGTSSSVLASFVRHPQAGSQIVGESLPDWSGIREMLMTFFDESSYLRACHLSFVLTDEGPSFLAASDGHLAAHQLHRPLLGDPFIASHISRLGA